MKIKKNWADFKTVLTNKTLQHHYEDEGNCYWVFAEDNNIDYECFVEKTDPKSADQTDFETNYQSTANKSVNPVDEDGKTYVRSESRPLNHTTNFTMCGDGASTIGDGKELSWDFSNTTDDTTAPSGFKRKRIEFEFIDPIYIKEGALYFKDALFGSYIDLYVVCKDQQYYLNNAGTPTQASGDTKVSHYLNHHMIMDTNVYGDELNTEAASSQIPTTYKFWLEITVPDTDSTSKGFAELELYRTRTMIL